jgi:hypothetical protein
MNRLLVASGLCFLLTASSALGSSVISIGMQQLNLDVEQRIPIMVSSNTHETVEGVNLAVQIADGGAANGGTATAPKIMSLDLIGPGTIFNASNTGSAPLYLGTGAQNLPPYLIALADTTTASGNLEANGVLAYLTINTFGAALGSYRVNLQSVGENVTAGPWTSDFAGIPATFPANDGWIVVVPEPTALLLSLAACGVFLCRRGSKLLG